MPEAIRKYEGDLSHYAPLIPSDLNSGRVGPSIQEYSWPLEKEVPTNRFRTDEDAYFQHGFPYVLAFLKDGDFAKNTLWRILSMSTGITANDSDILSHFVDCRSKESEEPSEVFMTMMIFDRVLEDTDNRIRFHIWVDGDMHTIFFSAKEIHRMYKEISKTTSGSITPEFASECFWITRMDQLKDFGIGCLYNTGSNTTVKNLDTMAICKACTGIYEEENFERIFTTVAERFGLAEFMFNEPYYIRVTDWHDDQTRDTLIGHRLKSGQFALFIGFSDDLRVAKFITATRENYNDWTVETAVLDITHEAIRHFGICINQVLGSVK